MVQISGKNATPFWSAQEEWLKYTCLSHSLSKEEGLKDIGHNMSIGNLILVVISVTALYWSVITVYYKIRQMLLQNATAVLLQNATEVY